MPRNRSEKTPDWQYELVAFALEVESRVPDENYSGLGDLRDCMSMEARLHWTYDCTWRTAANRVFKAYGRDAGSYSGPRVSG